MTITLRFTVNLDGWKQRGRRKRGGRGVELMIIVTMYLLSRSLSRSLSLSLSRSRSRSMVFVYCGIGEWIDGLLVCVDG